MKLPRRNFLHLAATATALPAMSRAATAQGYPTRPITFVVPFTAGGPTDALARVLAERMKAALVQSVIVENPTRAAGTIGTGRVARAAPDGYTVSRPLADARSQRRDLRAPVRRGKGLRVHKYSPGGMRICRGECRP